MAIAIRLADLQDLADVRGCVAEAFEIYLTRLPLPPAALSADYAALIGRREVYVAGAPPFAGTVSATGDATDLVMNNLAVRPSHQGTGVGRALVRFVEERAAEGGYERVTLFTHELMVENVGFYSSLGSPRRGDG